MNANHVHMPLTRQVQMELELSDSPAGLLPLHPDVEIEARSGSEPDRVALQFLNAICLLAQSNRLLREMLDPPMIFLLRQVCAHLSAQAIWRIQIQCI
jgi:hypothetical protein